MTNQSESATEESHLLLHPGSSSHHSSNHSTRQLHEHVPLYSRPKQRQRWDDVQMLPHFNWGDLYFDLFYVAAAYNLSHAFMDSPNPEGLLYFAACYLPCFQVWNEKLAYDARYSPDDNLFHRSLEIFHLCLVGTVVSYISPSEMMRNTSGNPDMTIFSGTLLLGTVSVIYAYYDLYKNVIGGEEAKKNAASELRKKLMGLIFPLAAFALSAKDYYFMEEEECINYWPAYCLIASFVVELTVYPLFYFLVFLPRMGVSHKTVLVPLNLEYLIHRIGEWVMLMLGESILSILTIGHHQATIDTVEEGHSSRIPTAIPFYAGILQITMFQYLFFRSQPSEAKDHVMRRSQWGGMFFFYNHTFYSAALILVGCSFKMILSPEKMLQQQEEDDYDYDITERIALVYAVSQAVSFMALDNMTTSHRGFRENFRRFRATFAGEGDTTSCAFVPTIVLLVNWALIVLTLCLSFVEDLALLSILGCLLVFCQTMLRTVGLKYFPVTIAQMERAKHPHRSSHLFDAQVDNESEHQRWPNVTEPVAVHSN